MGTDTTKPSPEQFLTLIRQQQRGRLKVYLGFAAGVGKTYEMLQEGHRLKRQGVDVVIGIVETHGRAETAAQVGDLEQVPRRAHRVPRRRSCEEMDLDAILAPPADRRAWSTSWPTPTPPAAATPSATRTSRSCSAPASTSSRTLNIQHLESLYDMVERVTGVKVKERVPDYVLGEADQIVNVDVSAEDLRERLQAGKVYPPERVERALENFFTPENLTRLREMALAEIAHLLDRRRREQRGGRRRRRLPSG